MDLQLLLHQGDALVELAAEQGGLPQQVVRVGEPGVLLQGEAQLRVREVVELGADHHLRGQQVRGRGGGIDGERARPGLARLRDLPRLDVGHAQHVRELGVVGGRFPRALEVGERVRDAAGEVQGQPQYLGRLDLLDRARGEPVDGRGEQRDGAGGLVRVVVRDAQQVAHAGIGGGIEG